METHLERIHDWEARARKAGHQASLLAQLCGTSLRQLERFFDNQLECSPHAWLDRTRLHHAVELFKSGLPGKELAPLVGLKSASSLCQFFRRLTGQSATQFIETVRVDPTRLPPLDLPAPVALTISFDI